MTWPVKGTVVNVREIRKGTSRKLSGSFQLCNNAGNLCTSSLAYNVASEKLSKEIEKINFGSVQNKISVARSAADFNNGYLWHITFESLVVPEPLVIKSQLSG